MRLTFPNYHIDLTRNYKRFSPLCAEHYYKHYLFFFLPHSARHSGERPEAMQTGSSISPTSTCFLTSTIAILIGSFGALSGNCNPLPSGTRFCRAIFDRFVRSKYAQTQTPQMALKWLASMGAFVLAIFVVNQCIQIAADLPSGWIYRLVVVACKVYFYGCCNSMRECVSAATNKW